MISAGIDRDNDFCGLDNGPICTSSLSVCLMNWLATFVLFFCPARTKLGNFHSVHTHCIGLTLLNCYPTFLL